MFRKFREIFLNSQKYIGLSLKITIKAYIHALDRYEVWLETRQALADNNSFGENPNC